MRILNSDRPSLDEILKKYLDNVDLDQWLSEDIILPPIPMKINLLDGDDDDTK